MCFYYSIPSVDRYKVKFIIDDNNLTSIKYVLSSENECFQWYKNEESSTRYNINLYERNIFEQIKAYFINPKFSFDIKLKPQGTDFQQKVWQAITNIPVGETLEYGQLAELINSGARAVANACRQNPYPIIIPCHRVVAKNNLGGYDGDSNERESNKLLIKKFLLQHELKQ